jgi:hypothetical protein
LIPAQIERAQLRFTLSRWMLPWLSLGVEANPEADELGPLVNLVAMLEGPRRPSVMFGVSSDRIGTPDGTAYFMTVAKDLESLWGWPVGAYVGAAYGTWEDELRPIGGLRARVAPGFAVQAIHDGVNLHPSIELELPGDQTLSVIWVETEMLGIAYSVAF